MPTLAPIFISHSTVDRDDVVTLGHALRDALRNKVRIFNTSEFSIDPGARWRDRVLAAIRDASMIILWATPNAIESKEVAFEIGAAYAYEKSIIPCCVHIPPVRLPWSLSEIQAHTVLDSEEGWNQLASTIANLANLPVAIDEVPLLQFAARFQATNKALEIEAVGMTIEIRNTSSSSVTDLLLDTAGDNPPVWIEGFQHAALRPGETKLLIRDADQIDRSVRLTWTDAVGIQHVRDATVPATAAANEQ